MNAPNFPAYFDAAMDMLCQHYPAWKPSIELLASYWTMLADVEPESLLWAVKAHVERSKWPPAVSDLRDLVRERGNVAMPTAAEAWEIMYRNRHRVDRRKKPEWPNEACLRAAQTIGWDDPNWESSAIPTLRAQFRDAYNGMVTKQGMVDRHQQIDELVSGQKRRMQQLYGADYRDPIEPAGIDMEARRLQAWDEGRSGDEDE